MVKRRFQTRKIQPSRFIFSKIGPWCTNTNTKNYEILKNAGGSCKENSALARYRYFWQTGNEKNYIGIEKTTKWMLWMPRETCAQNPKI